MNGKAKRRRGGLVALLVIVLLLALVCAAPFLYNALSHFEYDDPAALSAANTAPAELSADPDGAHMLFRMDKADVYTQFIRDGTLERIGDTLAGHATLERVGYTLTPEQAQIRLALKIFGFLPVQLQANAAIGIEGDAVHARLTDVRFGPWVRLSAEKAADLTKLEALNEQFEFPLKDYAEPLRADRVWIENDGVCISSPLLSEVLDEVAAQNAPWPRLLRLFYGAEIPASVKALLGEGRADFLRGGCASAEAVRAALRDVSAFGSDAYRDALKTDLGGLPIDLNSELDAAAAVRSAALEQIAAAQDRYAQAQLGLRQDYWHKNVTLTASHLLGAEGTPLEERLPAEWEARVVLMYNENYDAIVKTNEGNPRLQEPIPGLPLLSELPRDSWASVPQNGNGPFDLTLALRLPSGLPAVIFLTPEDEFGLAVIPETMFAELRDSPTLPIRSSADIITAPRDRWIRVTGLRDGLPAGNYIGAA